jgi:glucose-1-phosphate thymidylyltransferase
MKGIIFAGGRESRLLPLNQSISEGLLPVYDKPMIYYPLSSLMLAGIKDILIITPMQDISRYKELLGDGSNLGISISYAIETSSNETAQAFLIGEQFIGKDSVALILGDNLFYGIQFEKLLYEAIVQDKGAIVFGYLVDDPQQFDIISFSENGIVTSIEEKPTLPKTNYGMTGLYFYDNKVLEIAKNLRISKRNKMEISDINQIYLERGELSVKLLDRGNAWLKADVHQSLYTASQFIRRIEERQNIKIACIEEIAYQKGYITNEDLYNLAKPFMKNKYGEYLIKLLT